LVIKHCWSQVASLAVAAEFSVDDGVSIWLPENTYHFCAWSRLTKPKQVYKHDYHANYGPLVGSWIKKCISCSDDDDFLKTLKYRNNAILAVFSPTKQSAESSKVGTIYTS